MNEVKVHAIRSGDDDGIRFFAVTPPLADESDGRSEERPPGPDSAAPAVSPPDAGHHLSATTSGGITWYSLPTLEVVQSPPDLPLAASDGDIPAPDVRGAEPAIEIPHVCDPEQPSSEVGETAPSRASRLLGVDAARGVALLGMMSVHIIASKTEAGTMSTAWALAAGKSAALFAVLAGVGIALTTGRTQVLHGRPRVAATAALAVRALLIACVGLLLGSIVPFETAGVILVYYGLLFLLAIPLLGLSVRSLVVLTAVTAVGVPVLSHVVRSSIAAPELDNPTFADLLRAPEDLVTELAVTGLYPALPWIAYVCAGLAIGRSPLTRRGVVMGMIAAGVLLAWLSSTASWFLMGPLGGRDRLAEVATATMPLEDFTELLVWGADGTLPTTSAWWLAVLAPHTTTPLDIVHTIGVATAVIGMAVIVGRVAGPVLRPLAAAGSMPLTLYTLHLLLLVAPVMRDGAAAVFLLLQVVFLVSFAVFWARRFDRGPLEHLVHLAMHTVRAKILAGEDDARRGRGDRG
jgi:uncharacterized membrane protein